MAVFRNICVEKIQILKTCHMSAITNVSRINILIHQNYVRILVEYCHTLWKKTIYEKNEHFWTSVLMSRSTF